MFTWALLYKIMVLWPSPFSWSWTKSHLFYKLGYDLPRLYTNTRLCYQVTKARRCEKLKNSHCYSLLYILWPNKWWWWWSLLCWIKPSASQPRMLVVPSLVVYYYYFTFLTGQILFQIPQFSPVHDADSLGYCFVSFITGANYNIWRMKSKGPLLWTSNTT